MIFDPSDTPLPMIECPTEGTRTAGNLEVELDGKRIALPLAAISVDAHVARGVASVTVSQTYRNTFAEPLEAVYIFPLAGGCAVRDFSLRVGDRTIHSAIKERGEARADYAQAIEEGRRAALLEQERDDVFTVQLGNLPPGEDATVVITYSEMLDAMDLGMVELRLPFVVAPRYIPGDPQSGGSVGDGVESDTDVVPDASRITPPRLAPGFDPNVSLSLDVVIDAAGLTISDLGCTQHATRTHMGNGTVRIALARSDERLNRDFVLRWRESADAAIGASYFVSATATGESYGMITLYAPANKTTTSVPRDVL
ncbi:MAG TPA: VIT domain-containing protein, partial [Blastocatellia bacterium]|nr:VIT domain-containing protein [Blastocatellia bacterium]